MRDLARPKGFKYLRFQGTEEMFMPAIAVLRTASLEPEVMSTFT